MINTTYFIEVFRYEWAYLRRTHEIRISKMFFRYNGKRTKSIKRRKEEVVLIMSVPFEVPIIYGETEVTRYDFKAWAVSEQQYTEIIKIQTFNDAKLKEFFQSLVSQLPPQTYPINSK